MQRSDYLGGVLSNFDRFPRVQVTAAQVLVGWSAIVAEMLRRATRHGAGAPVIAIETYQGVDIERLQHEIRTTAGRRVEIVDTRERMKTDSRIAAMVRSDVTDDRVFGYMTRLTLRDFFPRHALEPEGAAAAHTTIVIGPGATLIAPDASLVVYADMPRWEIQQRQRNGSVDSLGLRNRATDPKLLYKQSFFVDWRVLDRHKQVALPQSDWYLETVDNERPQMVATAVIMRALQTTVGRPFALKPFFDPGVWGGDWMQQVCNLDDTAPNYAWGFTCVPEENSLLLQIGEATIEIPALNLVLFRTRELLGDPVHARFGTEFPIRFDLLDTMGGQNLSFQVHPLTEYIQQHFGMHYTQDESYYILDAKPGAVVYLGLRESVDPAAMRADLEAAGRGAVEFPAQRYVQTWPARKHDHYLIPAGTPHCSGAESLVLEISATPYIFTFKLWDWGRLDLDGRPRPINIERGWPNIQWDRTTSWTERNLVNRVQAVAAGDGWREERTGLHQRECIETRRHWCSVVVEHDTGGTECGGVHVLSLVEGREATVESPTNAFDPFVVHYAETFVVPAAVGRYRIRPSGESEGTTIATIRASVR